MQKITFVEFKDNTQKPIKQAEESNHNYNITGPKLQKQKNMQKNKTVFAETNNYAGKQHIQPIKSASTATFNRDVASPKIE